jgi:branched-chain amino acid transport system permease protein
VPIDWLDAFLISGLFEVVMVIGVALLLHLQLGLTRIANFGIVGFWGLGMYAFGVLYVQVDWAFGDPWQFLVCAALATLVAGLAGLLVGWLVADLDTDGVLVGTLGFATIVLILATTEQDLTGGALGMGGLRFPYDVGSVKENELTWLVLVSLVVVAIFLYARARSTARPLAGCSSRPAATRPSRAAWASPRRARGSCSSASPPRSWGCSAPSTASWCASSTSPTWAWTSRWPPSSASCSAAAPVSGARSWASC